MMMVMMEMTGMIVSNGESRVCSCKMTCQWSELLLELSRGKPAKQAGLPSE